MLPSKCIKFLFTATSLVFVLVLFGEVYVRLLGFTHVNISSDRKDNDIRSDDELGWIHKDVENKLTQNNPDNEIIFLGGSFTFGEGLETKQTFAYKLNHLFKHDNINNLAVAAYGTLQSYLVLKRYLKQNKSPKLVVYGFVDFHEYRNVSHWSWLTGMAKNNSGNIHMPYCRLKEKRISCEMTRTFKAWKTSQFSAFSFFIQSFFHKMQDLGLKNDLHLIMKHNLLMLKNSSEIHNSRFLIVYLHSLNRPKDFYINIFNELGLDYVDCIHPEAKTSEYVLQKNAHPNEKLNDFWVNCISNKLRKDYFLRN